MAEQLRSCLNSIVELTSGNAVKDVLIPILLDHHFLLPKSLRHTVYNNGTLPARFSKIWLPALKRFCKAWPYFLPTLLYFLAKKALGVSDKDRKTQKEFQPQKDQEKMETHKSSLLTCWCLYLLSEKELSPRNDQGVDVPWQSIILMCLENYSSKWSLLILEKILAQMSLPKRFLEHTRRLATFGASARELLSVSDKKNWRETKLSDFAKEQEKKLMSINDFQQILERHRGISECFTEQIPTNTLQPETAHGWSKCYNWHTCPIGLLEDTDDFPILNLPGELDKYHGMRQKRSNPEEISELIQIGNQQQIEDGRAKRMKLNQTEMQPAQGNDYFMTNPLQAMGSAWKPTSLLFSIDELSHFGISTLHSNT